MKNTLTAILFAAFAPGALASPTSYKIEVVGPVVTEKRTFTVDLEDCRKTYESSEFHGACTIAFSVGFAEELATGGTGKLNTYFQETYVDLIPGVAGYTLQVSRPRADVTLSFSNVKPFLERFISEKLPNKEVTVFVHTTVRPHL